MPVERFSVGVLVFLCLRKCILLLVVVVLVGVVSGGVDLPVEAAINEVSDGSLSFMEWWREIGCHLTRWAIDMFVEAANAKRLLPETDDEIKEEPSYFQKILGTFRITALVRILYIKHKSYPK
jgi:hypothetical protein